MIVADTSGLLAYFNAAEPTHDAVTALVEAESDPLVVSPYVLAELDYLVSTRIGLAAELTVLGEVAGGAYDLPSLGAQDLVAAAAVVSRYGDQQIGLADASIVILADRYDTRQILTLDRRHFTVLRNRHGKRFTLLP